MKWSLFFLAAVILLCAAVEFPNGKTIWTALSGDEAVGTLLAGWIGFLRHTLPQVTVYSPAIISGVTIVVLFTALLDGFARWCCRASSSASGAARRRWHFRWTLSIILGVSMMFAVGYCTIGLVRQVAWVISSRAPIRGEHLANSQYESYPPLTFMASGFRKYQDAHKQLPPGGTFDAQGNMMHSWETALLPYLFVQNTIDMKLPWNHPANAVYFQSVVAEFINVDFRTPELTDAEGYGLSHYAANSRVLRANAAVNPDKVPGGTSNTILVGEVNHAFRPWGHPVNWRDPATGVNRPNGFGGAPQSGGCQFIMMDGSVRFVRQDVDPAVLEALSGPADGSGSPGGSVEQSHR
jgi:hypothetical protein